VYIIIITKNVDISGTIVVHKCVQLKIFTCAMKIGFYDNNDGTCRLIFNTKLN